MDIVCYYEVVIIEDDVYGFLFCVVLLVIVSIGSELIYYVIGLVKSVGVGLCIVYMVVFDVVVVVCLIVVLCVIMVMVLLFILILVMYWICDGVVDLVLVNICKELMVW